MRHLKNKSFPQRGPVRMFPWPRCGSGRACLRHGHEFASVVIPVTFSTYRIVHVQIQQQKSSQSPHTFAKAMLFARWQHHLRFCSGFPYAPLKTMVTKISKWFRIQDSFWIISKIESLVVCVIPDIRSKFQKDPSITFWVILLTDRQTNKVWQKHYLLGGGNNDVLINAF